LPVILPAPELPPGPRAALVIATGSYKDTRLRTLRAPARDAEALTTVLRDPLIGRFEVTALRDRSVHDVRVEVEDFLCAREPRDTIVVYLSCHGLLSPRRRLYFAMADTDHERLASTALDARWLFECLEDCRARRQVVILDCCFSGAFALTKGARGPQDVGLEEQFGQQDSRGRIVLTASRATEYSFEGEALDEGVAAGVGAGSVFTTALVEGLRTGAADQDGDGLVSVSEAYGYVYSRVQAAGGAQTPQRWVYGGEGEVMLARSAAGITVEPAPLPEELAAALQSRYPGIRAVAVEHVAQWLASPDPAQALAARVALQEVVDQDLPTIAQIALTLLQSHSPLPQQPEAVRKTPARTSSPHIARLTEHIEHAALAIAREGRTWSTLSEAAKTVAFDDPARAKRIAQAIVKEDPRVYALVRVVRVAATRDPAQAERIALAIADERGRADALLTVVQVVASGDPKQAERLADLAENAALAIADGGSRANALAMVALMTAASDPARAERIALAITDDDYRVLALLQVVRAVAANAPARAARLADQAERAAQVVADASSKVYRLLEVARVVADSDAAQRGRLVGEAERIALAITDQFRANALLAVAVAVAEVMADGDPIRITSLVSEVERSTRAGDDYSARTSALLTGAKIVAGSNSAYAAELGGMARSAAEAIPDKWDQARALREIALAIAAGNPAGAETAALAITDPRSRLNTLLALVKMGASYDRARIGGLAERAEQTALAFTDDSRREWALCEVAKTLVASDEERAERIALAITSDFIRAHALAAVVAATVDPARARRLADQAERDALGVVDGQARAIALLEVIRAVAGSDPTRAARLTDQSERAALTTVNNPSRASALTAVVQVMTGDPDRATRLADQAELAALAIADDEDRLRALLALVEVTAAYDPAHAARLADQAERAGGLFIRRLRLAKVAS
jgi:Caspase domain